jgi:hypothetical protein
MPTAQPARPGPARRALPLLVSAAAIALVVWMVDLSELRGVHRRIDWTALPVVIGLVLGVIVAFAWRWFTLSRDQLPFGRAVNVVAIGLAGNQVLPLRGGDALRVLLSTRGRAAISLHASVSGLAMEKVFDLVAVSAFGLASVASVIGQSKGAAAQLPGVMTIALTILGLAAAVLVTAGTGLLGRVLRALCRRIGVPGRLYRHIAGPLMHLRHLASPRRVLLLLLQTAFIWLVLYVVAYLVLARMAGLELSVAESMVLLFAAALGLAVPAAPSGLGTFHAAVVSAFVILGRPPADGLLLAVTIHIVFFLGFCLVGAVALGLATREVGALSRRGESN